MRYTEPVGTIVGRFSLNLFFFVLMIADFIVISSLFSHFMGENFVISSFATLVLIALIDVLPIFIAVPYLAKILKGLISEDDDIQAYQVAIKFIWACFILFIVSVIIYFVMSVNYPERFENPTIQPVIAGLIPFMTTVASGLSNLVMTYFSKRDATLERLRVEREIESVKDELAILGESNTVLHDVDERVNAIQGRIKEYIETQNEHVELDQKIEQAEEMNKDRLLKESVLESFDKMCRDGEKTFIGEYMNDRRSRGYAIYQNWKLDMRMAREQISKLISYSELDEREEKSL